MNIVQLHSRIYFLYLNNTKKAEICKLKIIQKPLKNKKENKRKNFFSTLG